MMNITETERLILRRFTLDDVADMTLVMGDPEVMKYSVSGVMSFEQTRQFLERILATYQRRGFGLWAVEYKATGRVIGYCGYYFQEIDGKEEVELGYRLARSFWGKGIATEAARSMVNYAFSVLKLPRLISIIDVENVGSIKVAEKCGLTYSKTIDFHGIAVRIYALNVHESNRLAPS